MKTSIVGIGNHIDINKGGEPRTPGVHLSGVIRHIATEMDLLDLDEPQPDGNKFPLDARLKMSMGLAWEDWVQRQYPEVMYHPGEIACDGILMTPDGLHPDEILWEFKVTWKSAYKLFQEGYDHKSYWMWRAQNMGYLKALGWTRVRQCVLYVNGDYRGERPRFVELDVIYDQYEIDANWDLMLQYKDKAESE